MNVEGASILVTGGCGLIGSTTIEQLLREKPAKIVIYDNLVRGSMHNVEEILKDRRVELIKGDIRDVDHIRKAVDGMDGVVHMAALRITACAADPREAQEVMCDGTFNVVEAAHLAGVKKIVAASSASIYGLADHFPTQETGHPTAIARGTAQRRSCSKGCCAPLTICTALSTSRSATSTSTARGWIFTASTLKC
jgi:UDP-glucose 4-epimerase